MNEKMVKESRKKATVEKLDLHSKDHHSFHLDLDDKASWELLGRISKETWRLQTGVVPPFRVDKSVFKIISLHEKS